MKDLERFRKEKDRFFLTDKHSPLTAVQKRSFTGLGCFPKNLELQFHAEAEELAEKKSVTMQTTSGQVQQNSRWGRFRFAVNGQAAELTIYESDGGFFLPFVDSLAGKETYGAGRYLEPHRHDDGTFHIDFNYAYNPYGAYNDLWSCPIPPAENRLDVPIRAGEKLFERH